MVHRPNRPLRAAAAALVVAAGLGTAAAENGGGGYALAELRMAMAALYGPDATSTAADSTLRRLHAAVVPLRSVDAARAAGYVAVAPCHEDAGGASGVVYLNGAHVHAFWVDVAAPPIVLYEPAPEGALRLVGAGFAIAADRWHASGIARPPSMLGQTFVLGLVPGLEGIYVLPVWIEQANPDGLYASSNPLVQCGGPTLGTGPARGSDGRR